MIALVLGDELFSRRFELKKKLVRFVTLPCVAFERRASVAVRAARANLCTHPTLFRECRRRTPICRPHRACAAARFVCDTLRI